MFLFVAASLLLIKYVRTEADDYYDIQTEETEVVDYRMHDTSTATSFAQDKGMDTNPNIIQNPNFNQHVYKGDNMWNRQPHQPYRPLNIDFDAIRNWNPPTIKTYTPRPLDIDLNAIQNWNLPTMKFEDYTVPTIRYGRKGITDWKLFFSICSVVLLVALTFKLCIWLILYFRSRKLARTRNNLERIIIIRSESSPSQSDSVPSNTTPFLNGLGSSQSDSRLPQTNLETRNNDSKRIVILIPKKSQRDTSTAMEPSQLSDEDLRHNSGREMLNSYPELPPPYEERLNPYPAPPYE